MFEIFRRLPKKTKKQKTQKSCFDTKGFTFLLGDFDWNGRRLPLFCDETHGTSLAVGRGCDILTRCDDADMRITLGVSDVTPPPVTVVLERCARCVSCLLSCSCAVFSILWSLRFDCEIRYHCCLSVY